MKAATISEYGPRSVIQLTGVNCPEPRPGALRIRVSAARVGPWDAFVREGRSGIPQNLPLILGSDVAGSVDAIGAHVSDFSPGDEV